jgi:hypothetical protein
MGQLFRVIRPMLGPLYLAYSPDSHWVSRGHTDAASLFRRFALYNQANNGGDLPRFWALLLNLKQVLAEGVPGDFAELGVWRGNTAAILANFAALNDRKVFLFDTFEGFHAKDLVSVDRDKSMNFTDTSVETARRVVGEPSRCCEFIKGYFPDSVTDEARKARYAVVSLDCDLYEPMKAGLEFFYPRMTRGGIFFLHDYSSLQWNGAAQAIDEFCRASGEFLILCPDKSGSAFFRKSRENSTVPSSGLLSQVTFAVQSVGSNPK